MNLHLPNFVGKGRLKTSLTFIFLLLFTQSILAQERTKISGTVLNAKTKEALIGITVHVKNASLGSVTDFNGNFSFEAPKSENTILVFSSVGFQTKETKISQTTGLRIYLNEDNKTLNEIVVTALGVKRETRSLGYAVQEIDAKKLNSVNESNVVKSLSGKVAGVTITEGSSGVGSSSTIVIRGESSLTNNQPLFIVDGIPVNNATVANLTENLGNNEFQEVDFGNGIADLSTEDVASVSVLKGANAAALYGSRAANGVVIITTKKGVKSEGIGVSYSGSMTFENPLLLPQYQNAYGQGVNGKFSYEDGKGGGIEDAEDVSWGPLMNGQLIKQFDSPSTGVDANGKPIQLRGGDILGRDGSEITATPFRSHENNIEDFFETGITQTHNVALSSANENGNIRLSYSYLDSKGMIPNTNLIKNNYHLNAGLKINEKLNVSTVLNYINSHSNNRPSTGYGSENPMYIFTWYGRSVNTDNLKEYWQRGYEGTEQFNYNYSYHDNPYFALYENTNGFDKNRVIGNIVLNYEITDELSLLARTGLDFYQDDRSSKRAFSTQRFKNGAYREDKVSFTEQNTDVLLTYDKKLNNTWGLKLMAGGNIMHQKYDYSNTQTDALAAPGIYNFTNASVPLKAYKWKQRKTIQSAYALANISFNDYLFLDVSARNDWSSTFSKDNNSYFYPSASMSAVISDAIELPNFVSFFKLRTGLAQVGNDTDPYKLVTPYQTTGTYAGSNVMKSQAMTLNNADLKPERMTSFEIGTDIRLFKDRLGLDLTYYNNRTENQLISLATSVTSGAKKRFTNAGNIENQGIELMLYATPIVVGDFKWNVSFNYSKNQNKVLSLADGVDTYSVGYHSVYGAEGSKVHYLAKEGEPLGNMYGRKFKRTADGQLIHDAKGKPVVDSELQLLGNYNPDFMLGVSNGFTYKGISLDVLVDWRSGGTVVSRTKQIASYAGNLIETVNRPEDGIISEGVVNIGTDDKPNYVANTVALDYRTYYKTFNNRKTQQETGLEDASYVKLRELKLGYTFPTKFTNKLGIQNFKLAFIGRNLFIWTKNKHFDPETLAMQGQSLVKGVEDMSYPSSRSYGFSLSFDF